MKQSDVSESATSSATAGAGAVAGTDDASLPDFPSPSAGNGEPRPPRPGSPMLRLPPAARRRRLALRGASRADLPFLRALFHALREPELALAGWPEPLKRSFCDSQFALQHRSFVGAFPAADFLVVEAGNGPVGRLYLDRAQPIVHLIDIVLIPQVRGAGIGTILLAAVKHRAAAVTLHVLQQNRDARRLYKREGFRITGEEGAHFAMRWDAPDRQPSAADVRRPAAE